MKTLSFGLLFIFFVSSLQAQYVLDYLKAADNYFKKGDHASAATYYEKYLESLKTGAQKEVNPYSPPRGSKKLASSASRHASAIYQLAESYRLLNYPAKAEPYYRETIANSKEQFPLAQYHYAGIQRALGKYEDAEKEFRSFLDSYTNSDTYHDNAERELQNLQFIKTQLKKKDLKYYSVAKAPAYVNTEGASYAPSWLAANTLLFTSTRPADSTAAKKEYTNRIYQAAYTPGSISEVKKADIPEARNVHQGAVSATPDGNTIFITRWSMKERQKQSSLFVSTRGNDGWSDPVALDAGINAPGSNTKQPFVTADGKFLFFASDRAGGQGGFDIWYAPLNNGVPGQAANLGNTINTAHDEEAPFYHAPSSSLIFSTNGRIGMGGFDFFQSKGTLGNWSTPQNLGYPVNSIKDDIYFVSSHHGTT